MITGLVIYLAIFLYLAIGVIVYAVPNKLWPECIKHGFEGEDARLAAILLWPLILPLGLIYAALVWLYFLIMDE